MNPYFEINRDGHNIRCKIYSSEVHDISRIVLFCHGFGGHKDNRAAEKFAERVLTKYKRVAVVCFDWPAHGDDVKKKLQLSDCDAYLTLVIQFLYERYHPEALFAYGTSFGGYLLLKYISEHGNPFVKIALRCPAVDMYKTFTESIMNPDILEHLSKGKDVSVGFDRKVHVNRQFLDDLRYADIRKLDFIPFADDLLILHGTKDEIIPIEDSQAFCDNNVIEFEAVPNADHRFTDYKTMEQATKLILNFFNL
jgi:hypothetical protein